MSRKGNYDGPKEWQSVGIVHEAEVFVPKHGMVKISSEEYKEYCKQLSNDSPDLMKDLNRMIEEHRNSE